MRECVESQPRGVNYDSSEVIDSRINYKIEGTNIPTTVVVYLPIATITRPPSAYTYFYKLLIIYKATAYLVGTQNMETSYVPASYQMS